jgi:hypothetical protein
MKYHDAHEIFSYFLNQPPKMLRKIAFFASKKIQTKIPEKRESVTSRAPKVFMKRISGG